LCRAEKSQPGFVDDGRGLEGLVGAAAPQVAFGEGMKFPMYAGRKLFKCCWIAFPPAHQ